MKMEFVTLDSSAVTVSGERLQAEGTGAEMLVSVYRKYVGDWPKFFKMETLGKAGFLAAELLFRHLGWELTEDFTEDCAIVLFGRTASYSADSAYQKTVSDSENYFPSPAQFVYTLPNIVTGEIAIRRHLRGETSFYVMEKPDAHAMALHCMNAFQDCATQKVLLGWADSTSADDFKAFCTLVDRGIGLKEIEDGLNEII